MARRGSISVDNGLSIDTQVEGFSSGYGIIDYVSDCGILFPRATVTELAGLKSTSKTSLVLDTIAYNMYINPNFKVLYADFEKMIRKQGRYLLQLGIDIESPNFKVLSPDTMEDGMDDLRKELATSNYDLVVVDTIAAMRPKAESVNKTGETKQMGIRSKLMSEFLRNLTADLPQDGPAFVFINQLYKDITCTFGVKYDSPASGALEFYAGMRYQLKEKLKIKTKIRNPYTFEEEEIPTAMIVEIQNTKNKLGKPHLKTTYMFTYGFGIDTIPKLAETAYTAGVIKNKGASKAVFIVPISEEETRDINGRQAMWDFIANNLDAAKEVARQLDQVIEQKENRAINFWEHEIEMYEIRLKIREQYLDRLDDYQDPIEEDPEPEEKLKQPPKKIPLNESEDLLDSVSLSKPETQTPPKVKQKPKIFIN